MGLLWSMYSDPLMFLDIGAETIGIVPTIKRVFDDFDRAKSWEMFLAVKPNMSFSEWERENSRSAVCANIEKLGTKNEQETKEIILKSENILKSFKPMKGGKGCGK